MINFFELYIEYVVISGNRVAAHLSGLDKFRNLVAAHSYVDILGFDFAIASSRLGEDTTEKPLLEQLLSIVGMRC